MREKGTWYRAIEKNVEVDPANGKTFSLEELQKFVGGYIEKVPGTGTGRKGNPIAYCNEEGRLTGLPFNRFASVLFRQELVGDVIQVRRER